ncbi:uncharacterized protein B0I36DRAFT_261420 [Microdochium trichocladiopsis]|uniref:CENP-V/GFA domain-containing protein n=1 Tax=Microdochium trichocladiopsis TaxID=1682393 RepID=A0A9P8YJI4_9PEZI|nr:uncharacterized protein B0I36DRAFT_261420 [Microdochium trichocladiopsis]KAH7041569.1 hypothetical protein B0I36DRAFT_261420 [Microdochium trichocladiopsis]
MRPNTIELVSECLCKANRFTTRVPLLRLPLSATCCHCSTCRHFTGGLYTCTTAWPEQEEEEEEEEEERTENNYPRSPFSANADIFFCATCCTLMFFDCTEDGKASYGVIGKARELVKIRHNKFLAGTLDGGALPWTRDANPVDMGRPRMWMDGEQVPIRCYCGGVDLVLLNPRGATGVVSPDFVDAKTGKRRVVVDACGSCSKVVGTPLTYWTTAELRHIAYPPSSISARQFPRDTSELAAAAVEQAQSQRGGEGKANGLGSLMVFGSSPGVQRYSCARCSATVFYAHQQNPGQVNVALGVLRTGDDGVRAERVLAWDLPRSAVHFVDECRSEWRKAVVERMIASAERWNAENDRARTRYR